VSDPRAEPGRGPLVVLASSSPRRRELLERLGLRPLVQPSDVEERWHPCEPVERYVARVAREKAVAVRASQRGVAGAAEEAGVVVLGADTEVVLDGEPLGKPVDLEHARWMLHSLSGRSHRVLSAVELLTPSGDDLHLLDVAEVTFAHLGDERIEWYLRTGEPLGKAGGYALQGRGAALVERLDGDPSTVIGLPLRATAELLVRAGVRLWVVGAPSR
jgi:septum formation protein